MTEGRLPVRNPEVWLRQAGSENVAFDPARGVLHAMNPTAAAIWALCDGGTEPAEMIDAVCELSKLPYEVVTDDVERILRQFEEAGMIDWRLASR